jgi:hypothetical protein
MSDKLDDLLSKWPMRESTQLEAEEASERVLAAIEGGQTPATIDENLLAAPLPKTSEDEQTSQRPSISNSLTGRASGIGVESKMSKDRTRERTSFQELAKMATTPPPPTSVVPSSPASGSGPNRSSSVPSPVSSPSPASSSGSTGVVRGEESSSTDSGIVDLKAIASADPSGQQRAQSTPLASSGLFEDESAPPKPAVASATAEKLASTPPPSASAPAAAVAQAAPSAKKALEKKSDEKKSGGGVVIVIGALVAAAAIAAGVVMFVKYEHNKAALAAMAVSPGATTTAAATAKPQASGAASVADNDTTEEITDLPDTTNPGQPHVRHVRHVHTGGGPATPPEPPPTSTGVDPKLIANVPTGPAGGGGGDLAEAMKTAAGGGTGLGGNGAGGGTDQSKFAAGTVAQRPSQGQVAGAIGSVMQAARACLAADEPTSHANVTFQSDGSVKSVSVTGFAAGKPQEACIKGALSKAKVDPFAESSYPVPVILRPN